MTLFEFASIIIELYYCFYVCAIGKSLKYMEENLQKVYNSGDEFIEEEKLNRIRFFVLVAVLLALAVMPGFSQTAEFLDTLMESSAVNLEEAAFAVLSAAGVEIENSSPEAAFAEAQKRGVLPSNALAEDTIRLDQAAYLIMGAFEMKSGFMYSMFPGPRYAYRELTYRNLIQGQNDPALKVSGARLLRIIGRVLDYKGDL